MIQQSQIMTTYSLMRQQKNKNYSIPTISTPNHNSQRIATTSSSIFNLHPPTILPMVGKLYMCFLKEVKTYQAARYIKSSIMTKLIDFVLSTYL